MSADKIAASATTMGDRIGSLFMALSGFGNMIFGLLETTFTNTIWFICFSVCKKFWLKAPHFIGGHEGRPELDICSTYFGVNNSLLYTEVGQRFVPFPPLSYHHFELILTLSYLLLPLECVKKRSIIRWLRTQP